MADIESAALRLGEQKKKKKEEEEEQKDENIMVCPIP